MNRLDFLKTTILGLGGLSIALIKDKEKNNNLKFISIIKPGKVYVSKSVCKLKL